MDYHPDNEFDFSAAIHGVPFDKKWEIFQPELEFLFHSDKDYAAIAHHMKTKYAFDAQVSAYKYRFKKWQWKRSIPNHKKEEALTHIQKRTLQGKRTAAASYGTTDVDPKKLKRYIAGVKRPKFDLSSFVQGSDLELNSLGVYLPSGVRPFTMWNASFGGATRPGLLVSAPPSSNMKTNTPSDIDFRTPLHCHTPGRILPTSHSSPFSTTVLAHASNKRAELFSTGKLIDLVQTMDQSQQRIMSNWLYQFWFFAFKSAKDWGPNFRSFNVDDLEFPKYQSIRPSQLGETPGRSSSSSPARPIAKISEDIDLSPSDLCRWSIHVGNDVAWARVDNTPETDDRDVLGEWPQESFDHFLLNGLRENQFTTISTEQAPVNIKLIAEAAESSPQVLLKEAVSFAIMAQNYEALDRMLKERSSEEVRCILEEINAMHIATSYLNGGKHCCNILHLVCHNLGSIRRNAYSNDFGYTVLDNLMLTILKSHSTATMESVDDSLKSGTRYAGIEVDICGRWDADSPCFRTLVATGETSIPRHWKHKFCNTSVQAICHCIRVLSLSFNLPFKNESGLFHKLCTHCGIKLHLTSLHTLMMIAYVLANNYCSGEDLFGIIACYLCLLQSGLNPLEEVHISIAALTGLDGEFQGCNHQPMTPYCFIKTLPDPMKESWSKELEAGWRLLLEVCRRVEDEDPQARLAATSVTTTPEEYDQIDEEIQDIRDKISAEFPMRCNDNCWAVSSDEGSQFGRDPAVAHLWAAVQAEFLNYRRINEGDKWLSEQFDIVDLAHAFEYDEVPQTGYSRDNMLEDYCMCGEFTDWELPLREDVSRKDMYFANMDCWERTSFIARVNPAADDWE